MDNLEDYVPIEKKEWWYISYIATNRGKLHDLYEHEVIDQDPVEWVIETNGEFPEKYILLFAKQIDKMRFMEGDVNIG